MEQRKWANENSAADTPGARTGFHIPHLKWTNENSATDSNEPMRILQLIHLGQKLVCYKSHFKWTNENSAADTPGARTGFSYPTFELNQWELCNWFKWANENSTLYSWYTWGKNRFLTSQIWNEPMRTLHLIQMSQWEFCSWYTWDKNRFLTNHIFKWTNENSATDNPDTSSNVRMFSKERKILQQTWSLTC